MTIEKVEKLLLREFKTVPFHNIFMLNNKKIVASRLGGTCSDKVLHFRKILSRHGISSQLHSAFINNFECHRMLSLVLASRRYFVDVGSGWSCTKLFPAFEPIEYSVFGMSFKTELSGRNLLLFHKTDNNFKLMTEIPLVAKSEREILLDIDNRFDNKSIYPFKNSLRFSQIIDNQFYFLKGNRLRIFSEDKTLEKVLSRSEIYNLINYKFNFSLEDLNI